MKTFNTLISLCFLFLISSSLVNAQSLYISELSFNPCADQGNDGDCEYLVITNDSATTADISGYSINNGFSYTFPAGTSIPANGSISLGISNGCSTGTFDLSGDWSGSMSNSNDETIEILDAGGTLVSSVMYVGSIGDGDCEANCFDSAGTVSACASSVLAGLDCPGLGNAGDACTDANGGTSTVNGTDCTCTIVCATFGMACTDSDGDASTIDGNCNCIEVGAASDLYISELSFNPCAEQGNDGDCEYIVITNNGTSVADISNYSIGNGFSYTFPAGTTIPVGGSISLGISGNCTAGTFDLSGDWTGSMSNSNDETIEILDGSGALISSVTYDGTLGDGDCMANCFDASGIVSVCASSVLGSPTFDCPTIMANIGDTCTDSDGDASTIAADCTCTEVTPTFDCPAIMANVGDACTDSDGDASTLDASCMCIETDPPPPADIYISELSFNPCAEQGNDGDCEYLVITNNSTSVADISNYSISNGFSYTFPVGTTIPASGSISLGISGNCTAGAFDLSGDWTGSMSNSNDETIEILDGSGALISSVTYDGTLGDGDCMANCFDASGIVSVCASSVLGSPTFDCPTIMANIGDTCTDSDGDASTIAADCVCTEVTPTFDCPAIMANVGDACTDSDGDASTIDASCMCIETDPPPPADIYISELSFNPCTEQGNDGDCEYLVITNNGTSVADISNYSIGNGFSYTFPAGTTIPNGGSISLGILGSCTAGTFDLSGDWTGSMSNSNNETIEILDATGTLVSSVTYDGSLGDGNCLANCFDSNGLVAECISTILAGPTFDCPDIFANFGDTCDDGDANTTGDAIQNDCTCSGASLFDCPAEMANIGDLCDDGDSTTNYDIIQADCTCIGSVEMFDCPALQANVGDACDDGSPGTENDVVTDDCTCTGTGVCVADFTLSEITCDQIPGAPETYTVNIDFTGGGFDMFTITPNAGEISGLSCRCEGVVPPPPGDLIITELSFNPCSTQGNDGDCEYFILSNASANAIDLSGYTISNAFSFTFPDGTMIASGQNLAVGISENCPNAQFDITGGWSGSMGNSNAESLFLSDATGALIAVLTYDTGIADGDCMAQCFDNTGQTPTASTCLPSVFAEPDCTSLMLSIGDSCDDMDASTGNDMVLADCTCAGTAYDCPDIPAFFGDSCDDADVTTQMDEVQNDCTCAGTPSPPPGDIVILELSFNPCVTQGADGDCEYILIQNNGSTDYDLTGWTLANAFDYNFPDGTIIMPGQALSIGRSDNCAVATFDLGGGWDGSLGNSSNETIIILDDTGAMVSIYTYDANIANGDCMVQCFDAAAIPSACESAVYGDAPPFDCPSIMAYIGDSCDDNNEMTIMDEVQADCSCAGVLPTFECPDLMLDLEDTCDDGNENTVNDIIILGADNPDVDESGTIVITAIPEGTDLAFTITSANGCSFDINVTSPACEPVQVDCPATAKINEFHYDNAGTDANEFIEIVLPAGADPTLVQVDLINGSTGESYDFYLLTAADLVSTDGTSDYYVWNPSNLQNGPDGIALSCIDGSLYSFISYEGVITGVGSPVDGIMSTDVAVDEDSDTAENQSIMCDGTGVFLTNCIADPGAANDLNTCVDDIPGCIEPTACNYNENANVDDGSCVLAEGCDVCDGMGGIIDNPDVGELCDDGDPNTNYDTVQPDCTCLGTTETFDCPDLIANVGDACDDDNPSTENDVVTDECVCAGTPVCLADFMVGEVTCETVTGGTDSYTVNISFTGGSNDMFTIVPNAGQIDGLDCRCEGIAPPPPGDLVISELSFNPCSDQGSDGDCEYFVIANNGSAQIDLSGYAIDNAFTFIFPGGTTIDPGQSISVGITADCPVATFDIAGGWNGSMSNGNDETLDIIDAAGTLIGTFSYNGSLGDGNCMVQCFDNTATPSECESTVYAAPVFDCPALMLNFGADCDDMDATTGNDVILDDCTCVGTPFDCPTEMASFGDACDDGDATTLNDIVQNDCTCLGTVPPPPGDIIITELSYNPCSAQGSDGDCEYIVIKNNGTVDYDLTGWAIGSAFTYAFPVGTMITVGQSLSIGISGNCPVAQTVPFDLFGGWDGGMGNSGETILILDNNGAIVSSYAYDNAFGDGDCMAYCLDDAGIASTCESSIFGEPVYDCPDLMAFIGDTCDDNNEMTEMDEVQQDCTCVGIIPTFDCPDDMANLGDTCDDGDDTTIGDMIILGGDNPDFDNTGTIVVTSVPEGTDLVFTITSTNGCSFDINVPSPLCDPEPTDCEPNSGNFPWNGQ